jgi:hypothetical protein
MDYGGLTMNINTRLIRDMAIVSIIGFGLFIGFYVSIPDFPYDTPAWGFMLWGEASQWWSEITWIGAFCVLAISCLYLGSWNSEVKSNRPENYLLRIFRYMWLVTAVSLLFHYTAFYFWWTTWDGFFLKDNTGYLHGFFYIVTFLLGILVFGELIAYGAKVHGYLVKLSKVSPLE